ncbi:MAG TPA: M1 family aminopeptidase [Rhodanobacter sp.]|nr:M1 family aminopeptidase [Rhodanobacter sp.]
MFGEILCFELRQQVRSPLFWVITVALGALAFVATSSDMTATGGAIGNIHRNAPCVMINMLAIFSSLGLFVVPVFVGSAALRDFSAGTAELMFSTPVRHRAYLGGRFLAGWLVSVWVLIAVATGLWLGSLMPWLDATRLGPTPWAAYGWALGILVLPNLLVLGALVFLLATLTRSILGAWTGVIAFFVLRMIAGIALGGGNIAHQTAGALLGPFGISALQSVTRYWTAADRNLRIPELAGVMLANRVLWLAIGIALLAATFVLFKPGRERVPRLRRRTYVPTASTATPVALALPKALQRNGLTARLVQFVHLARFDARGVLHGVPFLIVLLIGFVNLGWRLSVSDDVFGTSVWPVTHLMAQVMANSFNYLLFIVIGFYAGELVWRERSCRVNAVTDAFPLPDWIPVLSKVVALAAVVVAFLVFGSIFCIGYQWFSGYRHVQPWLYVQYIGLALPGFLLFAVLAVVLQVWANNKFVGYALLVAYLISHAVLAQFDLVDHLYSYGSAPGTPYSDMNRFGTFWIGNLWFRAYWGAFAVALLVLGVLCRVRGEASGWRARGRIARQRFSAPARVALAVSLVAFIAIGAFIHHNTHGFYHDQSDDEARQLAVNYEKSYRKYAGMAQPRIIDVKVDVAMYPARRTVDIDGHYTLVNRHAAPISELLVQLPTPDTQTFKVELDFAAHTVVHADLAQGFRLYRLSTPLAPGASMPFGFRYHLAYPGFANEPTGQRVVQNGIFLTNFLFPHFCYDHDRELADGSARRKYGLGPASRLPSREDAAAHRDNALSCDADWVHFDGTLSTSADQIAVAPGHLQKTWMQGGRRYFHYVQDTPILDFFSFQSARYKIARDQWHDVALAVYYDPQHPYNIKRFFAAMKHSLDYYTAHFGPYQFRQLRVLEFPDYRQYAESFANTIPFSESLGFIADLRKSSDIDYVTYFTAHEVAHQWWGYQATGAKVQGAKVLDESLAQYSALMVMKHLYGPTAMRKFLKYELDGYLSGRAGESDAEEPLARVDDQPYIYYDKGSVVFYALQDYLGEDNVDAALRAWLKTVKFQQAPYTDTSQLVADLRAEAGPRYQSLITDFFERITLFDDRMVSATAKRLPNGKYAVTMRVHAAKYYADGNGKETRAMMDLPVEIGIFAKADDGQEQSEKPLYLEKHPVSDGDSTITVVVDGKPYQAGIDPFNELIDRVSGDNRAMVAIK